MATSFTAALVNLDTQVKGYAPLIAFCQAKWGRKLTMFPTVKKRREVRSQHVPVLMFSRPAVSDQEYHQTHDGVHEVRLVAGFHQPKDDLALLEQIRFEELLTDAVMSDESLSEVAGGIEITGTANSQSSHHPFYFSVIDLAVTFERDLVDPEELEDLDEVEYDFGDDGRIIGKDIISLG